jgi:inhibitor of KinA sporulation pathway (predicted exonuclease)
MATKLDKLIVIDLEATCDEPRPAWKSEIIEIGACFLDKQTLKVYGERSWLIKPTKTPITKFCTKLTTITPEMVEKDGVTLQQALKELEEEYQISKRSWASWGNYDRRMLQYDCKDKGIEFAGNDSNHINLSFLIAFELGEFKERGVEAVMQDFGLEMHGTHHRGVDDAVNIARLYAEHCQRQRDSLPKY